MQLTLSGHQDIVTGLRLSPDGNALLSNSMDNTMRSWDIKPYAAEDRCEKIFLGAQVQRRHRPRHTRPPPHSWTIRPRGLSGQHAASSAPLVTCGVGAAPQHNYEKGLLKCSWSKNATQVAAGSADNFVYVWSADSKRILYKLPGHKGTVNEVDFHPTQPIISSCSNDKQIYLGEIRG